jgi:tagatose 1,6-diphosphate aldolase
VQERAKPWFARYGLTHEELAGFRACEGWHARYGGGTPSETARGPVAAGEVY